MRVTFDKIKKFLSWLAETPHNLVSMTNGLENSRLQINPDEDTWSVIDILAHLRACADVWGKSIEAMISHDHPTLRYVSPRSWMKKNNYSSQEFRLSLQVFTDQRADLLKSLKVNEWYRGATFTGTVRGREQTIFSYAQRIDDHELEHLEPIKKCINCN